MKVATEMQTFKTTVIKSLVTVTLLLFLPAIIKPQAAQPDGSGFKSGVLPKVWLE